MRDDVRFALLRSLEGDCKPVVFESLDGLCRHIHRARRGAQLQLADHVAHFRDDRPEGRRVVAVHAQTDTGAPIAFIGWAWLDGASWRALQAALYAVEANPAVRAEAA